jgi:hypothetical protein
MQHDTGRPVAAFEFFAGAARAWIVAARSRRFVELSQSFPRGATGIEADNLTFFTSWRIVTKMLDKYETVCSFPS